MLRDSLLAPSSGLRLLLDTSNLFNGQCDLRMLHHAALQLDLYYRWIVATSPPLRLNGLRAGSAGSEQPEWMASLPNSGRSCVPRTALRHIVLLPFAMFVGKGRLSQRSGIKLA